MRRSSSHYHGSARAAQEAKEKSEAAVHRGDLERRLCEQERKRQALEARIEALRAEFAAESEELQAMSAEEAKRQKASAGERAEMARLRKAD